MVGHAIYGVDEPFERWQEAVILRQPRLDLPGLLQHVIQRGNQAEHDPWA